MNDRMREIITDAQHRLLQAMHELDVVREMSRRYYDDDNTNKLDKVYQAVSELDDRLGDIKSGRN